MKFDNFIRHLKLEALSLALLMVVLTYESPYSLWWLLISFVVFDIGVVGYIFNPKLGAKTYNFTHNYTIPTLFIAVGVMIPNDLLSLVGYCWIFHISIDRTFGYGLKHKHSFKRTHMSSHN